MKVYIAGKITGYPEYKAKFKEAEKMLKSKGHTVFNPTVLPNNLTADEYKHIEMSIIDICDAIYLLDNWRDSEGARYEKFYASLNLKRIYFQDENEKPMTIDRI